MLRGWRRHFRYWRQGRPWVRCAACNLPVPVDLEPVDEEKRIELVGVSTNDGRRKPRIEWKIFRSGASRPQSPDEGFLYDSSPVGEIQKEPWPPDFIDRVEVAPGVFEHVPVHRMRAVGATPHARRWVCSLDCKERLDALVIKDAGTPGENVHAGLWKHGL